MLRIVSRHSVRRPRTAGSSGEEQAVGQLHFAQHPNCYLRPFTFLNLSKLKCSDTLKTVYRSPIHSWQKISKPQLKIKAKHDLQCNTFQHFNIVDNIKEYLKWWLQLVCKMHAGLTLCSKLHGLLNSVVEFKQSETLKSTDFSILVLTQCACTPSYGNSRTAALWR